MCRSTFAIRCTSRMTSLRPAYNPPSRRQLSGKLLDKVHEKIVTRKERSIDRSGKQMSLLVDGWQISSSNRHNVVFMLAIAENEKLFLESFDFPSTRETGPNVLNQFYSDVKGTRKRLLYTSINRRDLRRRRRRR